MGTWVWGRQRRPTPKAKDKKVFQQPKEKEMKPKFVS